LWEDNCLQVVGDIKTLTKEEHLNSDLSCLIKLQDNDLEIRRLKQEIASLPSRQLHIENEFSDSVREYLDLAQELETARTDRTASRLILLPNRKMQKSKPTSLEATNERSIQQPSVIASPRRRSDRSRPKFSSCSKLEQLEAQVAERKRRLTSVGSRSTGS
jgi:hypothetical protein